MCEFCTQHGEGKIWYLNARNYAAELLDEAERKNFIGHFYEEVVQKGNRQVSILEKLMIGKIGLPEKIRHRITAEHKRMHFGQVVPLADAEKIVSMAHSIIRIACGCAWAKERKENRVCFGVSFGPPHWFDGVDIDYFGKPGNSMMDEMTRDEALRALRETDARGLVHSVWTFETPFIGAICNCEKQYCLAMRMTVGMRTPVMFRAEYVAEITLGQCDGCRACKDKCQFSAIRYDEKQDTCAIDKIRCFGCGLCMTQCPSNAIALLPRTLDPATALVW